MTSAKKSGRAALRRDSYPSSDSSRTRSAWIMAAAVSVAVLVAYAPALSGGFVLDDDKLLTDNQLILAPDGLYGIWFTTKALDYWPLTNSVLWVEWRLFGLNSTGYHTVNVLLHILDTLLIGTIVAELSIPGAFLAAMIFALHPVNVESVAWISQIKNVLAMTFCLGSVLFFLRSEDGKSRRVILPKLSVEAAYRASVVMFVLAMLSKASVAVVPVLLVVIIAWRRPFSRADAPRLVPFFAVAVSLTLVSLWFQTHGGQAIRDIGPLERLLGAGTVIWFYLWKALLPLRLAFIYPQWHIDPTQWSWWLPLIAAVVMSAVLWSFRHGRLRPLWFLWLFFCIALLPVMGFNDVSFMAYSLVADHYQHIAIIAVAVGIGAGLERARQSLGTRSRPLDGAIAAGVILLGVFTFLQSSLYADPITLYRDTLAKNPDSYLIHTNLGAALTRSDRRPEAIAEYQEALRLKPDYAEAHNNLGGELNNLGRSDEALEQFEVATKLKPNFLIAHGNAGVLLMKMGRIQDAVPHFEAAARLQPRNADLHLALGSALSMLGRNPEAIAPLREAVRLNPDSVDARNNLATVLAQTGNRDEAIAQYREALRLRPGDATAQGNLNAVLQMGTGTANQVSQ